MVEWGVHAQVGGCMGRWGVVDVETTGFSRLDRIVEVAVVVLDDRASSVTAEFATLVNPQRPMGATGVHGITESMVASAPTFEEIAIESHHRALADARAAVALPMQQTVPGSPVPCRIGPL